MLEDTAVMEEDHEDLISGIETMTCSECGRQSSVNYVAGPEHGDWNDNFDIRCAKCDAPLGSFSAFRAPVVTLQKRKRS